MAFLGNNARALGSQVGGVGETAGNGLGQYWDYVTAPAINLGDSLGLNGSKGGGPQAANIMQPSTVGQANQLYDQSQAGLAQQQAFVTALQGQNGIGNQSNVFNQQQGLANQLQQQSMGQGPNPVQAQLAQNTGQNIAAQTAMMGSQRGASSNAGLLARQAAMQGANTQQQSVGQAATLGAQQQLAAQQQLMAQQANMANLSTNQVNQLGTGVNQYNQSVQNEQQNVLNSIAQSNNANVSNAASMNSANAQANQANAGIMGSLIGAGGSVLSSGMFAHGGMVPQGYADGGQVNVVGPQSQVGQFLNSSNHSADSMQSMPMQQAAPQQDPMAGMMKTVGQLAPIAMALLSKGGNVPGQAKVSGDSYSNDTVPAMLSPGEVVIPRHVMESKDPAAAAAKFVRACLAKSGKLK